MLRRFSSVPYSVKKGVIVLRIEDKAAYRVKLDNANGESETVTAHMHPKGVGVNLKLNSPVFVNTTASEIIACGSLDANTNKISFKKFACIHPERPIEKIDKLCANCPRRSN